MHTYHANECDFDAVMIDPLLFIIDCDDDHALDIVIFSKDLPPLVVYHYLALDLGSCNALDSLH